MALKINTVADSISKLVVTGLSIKDIDEIPGKLEGRDCPFLTLDPDSPVTFDSLDFVTMGGANAKKDAHYTLNYLLVYGQAGKGRTNKLESISGMISLAQRIVEAIIGATAIDGAVDWNASIGYTAVINWGGVSFDSIGIHVPITEFVT